MANTPQIKALIRAKCPKCRRGKMFNGATYSLGGNKMHERCPRCGMYFEIEPGYFYASMYISYALNVAEAVSLAIATYVLTGNWSRHGYI